MTVLAFAPNPDVLPTFLSGANIPYLLEIYARYLQDPSSIDASWAQYFATMGDHGHAALHDMLGASWSPRDLTTVVDAPGAASPVAQSPKAAGQPASSLRAVADQADSAAAEALLNLRAANLVEAYRRYGHQLATLDPLGLAKSQLTAPLQPITHGLESVDFTKTVTLQSPVLGRNRMTVGELLQSLQAVYCQSVGVEVMHIGDPQRRDWLLQKIEGGAWMQPMPADTQRTLLQHLTQAEGLEQFWQKKFASVIRFGLDGGESLIPGLHTVFERFSRYGVAEVVVGMAHRGRLNIMANVMGKPYRALFAEFQGHMPIPDDFYGSGDVKYHLGVSHDRDYGGSPIRVSMTPNPSHLEAVNAVVQGKVRAKQDLRGDKTRKQVAAVLLHGDAAFAGQGSVVEALNLSRLPGYCSGGTLHIITNNQVGFTTSPQYGRSFAYASGTALGFEMPIFHVQGDDVEVVTKLLSLAVEYQQTFGEDILIDLICYRRAGHNEVDEPSFTQPRMYSQIAHQPSTRTQYAAKLVAAGVITAEQEQQAVKAFQSLLDAELAAADGYRVTSMDWLRDNWQGLKPAPRYDSNSAAWNPMTGVALDRLQTLGKNLTQLPSGFTPHPKIDRFLAERLNSVVTGKDINWATAEALAFASLATEGASVRLSGQDCGRGTFSQRHAVLTDQVTEQKYTSANQLDPEQGLVEVLDSPLSEYAVMGFEYGISQGTPNCLVMWEGQFGDFVNGAQIIIDQFISSAETKWQRMSGLVLLLPHALEGRGPEHSSGRVERFLQQCAEDNMQVANCSTPANYFHILRRQLKRDFRKPLILLTPKSLLRHKLCVSSLTDMAEGTRFEEVIAEADTTIKPTAVKRVVLCSGKVYYDLLQERIATGNKQVVLVRLEQYYPFPLAALVKQLQRYPNAELVWCQEENENMGAWRYLDRHLERAAQAAGMATPLPVRYIGRDAFAAPATGSHHRHEAQQKALVTAALALS
ncbi:MAG: 2-oxoglutarate dehydrogenase E1 component [Alphaproteobacteria bacterium]|nr:2-oxoglutarate dehydrogenase E1 component [Alphaproteobacteria bacterium]